MRHVTRLIYKDITCVITDFAMLHSVWRCVLMQLGDVIAGAGLLVLIELCSTKLDNTPAMVCVFIGFLGALALRAVQSPLFYATSLVFNLVVSLSVTLSVFARLCSPEGREFALIPVYVLLCMSRPLVTPLSGVVLSLLSLSLLSVFFIVKWRNPDITEADLSSALTVADSNSTFLQGLSLVAVSVYGSMSHMSSVYTANEVPPPFEYDLTGGVCRLAVIAAVGLSKSTFLYLFLSMPRQSPNYLSAFYGICLLIACMHMASAWFQQLKSLTAVVSGRPYTARRLVRLQHIVNAVLVGAAWAFPLHLGELRVLVVGCLLIGQVIYGVLGARGL